MISNRLSVPPRVLVLMPMLPGYEAVRQTVAATVEDALYGVLYSTEMGE